MDGTLVRSWARHDLSIPDPYVQINAEVYQVGDSIAAKVVAKRLLARDKTLSAPKCLFTNEGITARALDSKSIRFSGTYRADAKSLYESLLTGAPLTNCGHVTSS